jgi:RNA-directed DNA polymerase
VIEPIFEADMLGCSFGFRPRRTARDALQVLIDGAWGGRRWVVETDIADCFEAIPHGRLIAAIEERIVDRHILKLLRAMLRAGVLHEGAITRRVTGTPQGGVISPLLANIYLHRLDRCWQTREHGVLVRYADDLVAMCFTERQANSALRALEDNLAGLGLRLKPSKTRIVHLREGGEGLEFLGFEHRWVRSRGPRSRHVAYLARWPSRNAMQHARDRIRELTVRDRLLLSVESIVRDLNQFLRGWAGYFRYGNSSPSFDAIQAHAIKRLASFVAKRHKRSRGYGWAAVAYRSPNRMGLLDITGAVVAPRPNRDWHG